MAFACSPAAIVPPEVPLRPADAIVVLGNRPPRDQHGVVRPELRRRVEAGVARYREGLAPVVVMTGGPAPSGDIEADVMRELAVTLGVPPQAIRTERRSMDTIENAGFTVALLCGADPACTPRLIVVTSPYHLRRAGELFACAGADAQLAHAETPESDPGYGRRFAFFEALIRLYYGFIDPCERAARARHEAAASGPPPERGEDVDESR